MSVSAGLPSDFGNADQLNVQLVKMLRTVEDIISFAVKLKIADPQYKMLIRSLLIVNVLIFSAGTCK